MAGVRFTTVRLTARAPGVTKVTWTNPNTKPHHHFYNVDTGELTDIDARDIRVTGLPPLPRGVTTAGVDIIVRIRSTVA